MPNPALRALIYLRDYGCHDRCVAHCDRHGYRVVGMVHDPDGTRWPEVVTAGFAGQFEVVVYCPGCGSPPPERVPRMEPADEPEVEAVDAQVEVVDVDEVRPLYRRPRPRE